MGWFNSHLTARFLWVQGIGCNRMQPQTIFRYAQYIIK